MGLKVGVGQKPPTNTNNKRPLFFLNNPDPTHRTKIYVKFPTPFMCYFFCFHLALGTKKNQKVSPKRILVIYNKKFKINTPSFLSPPSPSPLSSPTILFDGGLNGTFKI